ncbi:hypothetical protein [Nocardia seriolae]|uniref:Non-specific serine/threonine protein kinase n=2 Tax=Nocardia seriolae TaxID=37332 RepID=A0ABC9YTR8_9NOCA|nr:hypothetical protein [Nocardia seriolae]BEK97366.1 hypothetical protein NSER024013_52720 [Nocardia seriolae]GAM46580.1 hypothetical protein NS07_v2contig00032-0057 [Nocardia seriolae]GAP28538.1 hypothetical protein NSK11_contig00037-0059 [Nocardia seriolae]
MKAPDRSSDETIRGASNRNYRVESATLNDLGGQSLLYRCHQPDGRVRVYKKYNTPVTDKADIAALRDIVKRGKRIQAAAEHNGTVATAAESSVNWPIDIVYEGKAVVGVVLPMIPPEFIGEHGKPLSLDFLYVPEAGPPETKDRIGVLIRACEIMILLESEGLVHGDISMRNIVWNRSSPHAYLIDCDGIRPAAGVFSHGVGTPGWLDPRWVDQCIAAHDRYSDRFGIAVMIYRGLLLNRGAPGLVNGQWQQPSGVPDDLAPELKTLFERAFHDPFETDGRPTASEWRDALKSAFMTADGTAYRKAALAVVDRHASQFLLPVKKAASPAAKKAGASSAKKIVSPRAKKAAPSPAKKTPPAKKATPSVQKQPTPAAASAIGPQATTLQKPGIAVSASSSAGVPASTSSPLRVSPPPPPAQAPAISMPTPNIRSKAKGSAWKTWTFIASLAMLMTAIIAVNESFSSNSHSGAAVTSTPSSSLTTEHPYATTKTTVVATTITTAPVASVGDCVAVGRDGALVEPGTCRGGPPYRVVSVVSPTYSCDDSRMGRVTTGGRLYCLVPNIIPYQCYSTPTPSEWLTLKECGSPGSVQVIDVVPMSNRNDLCTKTFSWDSSYSYNIPSQTVCVKVMPLSGATTTMTAPVTATKNAPSPTFPSAGGLTEGMSCDPARDGRSKDKYGLWMKCTSISGFSPIWISTPTVLGNAKPGDACRIDQIGIAVGPNDEDLYCFGGTWGIAPR